MRCMKTQVASRAAQERASARRTSTAVSFASDCSGAGDSSSAFFSASVSGSLVAFLLFLASWEFSLGLVLGSAASTAACC